MSRFQNLGIVSGHASVLLMFRIGTGVLSNAGFGTIGDIIALICKNAQVPESLVSSTGEYFASNGQPTIPKAGKRKESGQL